jgi:hypothetical protein
MTAFSHIAVRRAFGVWSVMTGPRGARRRVATFRGPGARTRAFLREAELNTRLGAELAAEAADNWRAAAIWRQASASMRRRR